MYKLHIKYKKKADFQRKHLEYIIGMVSPAHKYGVTIDGMATPMVTGGTFTFNYDKKEHADKLATTIFETYGNYIDIMKEYE